jgi:hemolysin activation/secretion protein
MKSFRLAALIAGSSLGLTALAQTATDPGSLLRDQQDTQRFYELQKRIREGGPAEEGVIRDETPKPTLQEAAGADTKITVDRVKTGPSKVLKPAEITAITQPLEGREITIKDLFDAVRAINLLYRDRGCVTCQAFLPPQKVEDGSVEIRLVEGRLGEIRVEGGRYIRDSYILNRISQKPGEVLDAKRLEKDLSFINSTNEFRVAAALKPGKEFGVVDASILPREPARFQGTIFGDNAGRDDVGRIRAGAILNVRSVFGYSDPFTAFLTGAEGTRAASLAYNFPFTRFGTRLGLSYDYSNIDIVNGPFATIGIKGQSTNAGVNLVQPLLADGVTRWNLSVGYNTRDTVTDIGNSGAQTRIDTRSFFLGTDLQRSTSLGFWSTRHTVIKGLQDFGGDRDFIKYTADALWLGTWQNGVTGVFRGAFQLSNVHDLPPYEQFLIGGAATVRGFLEGQRVGNRGYFLSAEAQMPLLTSDDSTVVGDRLKGVVFVDHGGAFPLRPATVGPSSDNYLTSVGTGLMFSLSRWLSGRVSLGIPTDTRGPDFRKWVMHVYVQAIAF